jgi:hypothetical protein
MSVNIDLKQVYCARNVVNPNTCPNSGLTHVAPNVPVAALRVKSRGTLHARMKRDNVQYPIS